MRRHSHERPSRNFDKILLAEIIAILKHQPGVCEKESKSPFIFSKSGRKRTSIFALSLWLHALQLSNMPPNQEGDLPTHHLACVCNIVIMGAASPALTHEVSEIIMSSIGVFPVDFPRSFNFSYMSVFTEKSYILII